MLKSTDPLFNHQYNYYNICQQTKQSASDHLSKLVSAGKAAEIDGQSIEDNLVHRFPSSMTDQKFKDKILEAPKVDGKIQFVSMKDKIRDYESNMAILNVSKPQANSSKKATSKPCGIKPGRK